MTNRRYVIFSLAACTSFLLYLHRYTWNLVRPELQAEYDLSNTQLEALGSAFFFPYAMGQVPGGMLCDLFGPHLFLVAIILLWSVLLPLHSWGGNFGLLLTVRGGFGLAQAGAYPALSKVTRSWFPRRSRTTVQGWIASAFGRGGGAMASIIMGTLLMGYLGLHWVTALIVLSAVGVVFALLFLLLFRNSPSEDPWTSEAEAALIREDELVDSEQGSVLPFRKTITNPSYVILLLQQYLNAGSDVVFVLILGSYFHSLGFESEYFNRLWWIESDAARLGLLVSLPLLGGALGGVFGGFANDWAIRRFQNRRWGRSLVAFTGLLIGGTLVLVSVSYSDPFIVGVGLMIARFFTDWNQPTVWGTCTDMGGKYSATVFGFNNMVGNLGAFSVPFAVGPLLDYYTTSSVIDGQVVELTNFSPAFTLAGVMMLASAICWLFIDCSKPIVPSAQELP